jgi:hypothetical protein
MRDPVPSLFREDRILSPEQLIPPVTKLIYGVVGAADLFYRWRMQFDPKFVHRRVPCNQILTIL